MTLRVEQMKAAFTEALRLPFTYQVASAKYPDACANAKKNKTPLPCKRTESCLSENGFWHAVIVGTP